MGDSVGIVEAAVATNENMTKVMEGNFVEVYATLNRVVGNIEDFNSIAGRLEISLDGLENKFTEALESLTNTENNVQLLAGDAVLMNKSIVGITANLSSLGWNIATLTKGIEVIETTVATTEKMTKVMDVNFGEVQAALDSVEEDINILENSGMLHTSLDGLEKQLAVIKGLLNNTENN